MIWIILSIIFTIITVASLRGATIVKYEYAKIVDKGNASIPVWLALITFLVYCIPIFGILIFIAYNIWFFHSCVRKKPSKYDYRCYKIELSDNNVLHKILKSVINLLTKEL